MCAIIGIIGDPEAAQHAAFGLHKMQHRGKESTGIISIDDSFALHQVIEPGLVSRVLEEEKLRTLTGTLAVGHLRYSTAGKSGTENRQPLTGMVNGCRLVIAHNGTLTNHGALRKVLGEKGAVFTSDVDSELFIHLIAQSKADGIEGKVRDAVGRVEGAYSLIISVADQGLNQKKLIAVRDPYGFRPLCMGKRGDVTIFSSESCALDVMGAEYVREIEKGEMVTVYGDNPVPVSSMIDAAKEPRQCIFEMIYFLRPDSLVFGTKRSANTFREALGRQLAKECAGQIGDGRINADVIISVPDSGRPAALGFADETGLPYKEGLVRGHYGRTFIEPTQAIRERGVLLKLDTVPDVIEGKRVMVIDDSIVRGTTSKRIITMLYSVGAKEVHLGIHSPPNRWACHQGMDTPDDNELIAHRMPVSRIRDFLGVNTLTYLSREGMLNVARELTGINTWCDACFSGEYPINVEHLKNPAALRPRE